MDGAAVGLWEEHPIPSVRDDGSWVWGVDGEGRK